ncbi:MAG: N-acetyl-gamma-glutamyl-phosphate reductase, partial [Pseudomonadota bacterium]
MSKKIRVSVIGGTGYAAAELIRRLLNHPHVEISKLASIDHVGENIGQVHRNFGNRLPYIFENISPEDVAKQSDLVFLTLPHKISFTMIPRLFQSGVKIVDFSGDYRIQEPAQYEKYYQVKHSNPENIKTFVYGLPELNREQIAKATRIANPGCFATCTELALLPLAKQGILNNVRVKVCGPTGSSGSGVKPGEGTHHPVRVNNLKSYKPLDHQHQPEMEQTIRLAGSPKAHIDFIPMSAPLVRGILVNCMMDLPTSISDDELDKIYRDYYQKEPFVRVLPKKQFPETVNIYGTNFTEIG